MAGESEEISGAALGGTVAAIRVGVDGKGVALTAPGVRVVGMGSAATQAVSSESSRVTPNRWIGRRIYCWRVTYKEF